MSGIEGIVREAEAERASIAKSRQESENRQAGIRDQESVKNKLEADAAFIALDECEQRLQSLYNVSNRAIKDKLWTVIQQTINSKEELKQIYR